MLAGSSWSPSSRHLARLAALHCVYLEKPLTRQTWRIPSPCHCRRAIPHASLEESLTMPSSKETFIVPPNSSGRPSQCCPGGALHCSTLEEHFTMPAQRIASPRSTGGVLQCTALENPMMGLPPRSPSSCCSTGLESFTTLPWRHIESWHLGVSIIAPPSLSWSP